MFNEMGYFRLKDTALIPKKPHLVAILLENLFIIIIIIIINANQLYVERYIILFFCKLRKKLVFIFFLSLLIYGSVR